MALNSEIKCVFVGDVAFNKDITPFEERVSIGGAAYYCAVGAIAACRALDLDPAVGIVASVGGDFDMDYLLEKNIDVQGITIFPDEKTCCFTITQYSDNTRGFEAQRFVAEDVRTEAFPSSYLSAQYIHLATSLPKNYQKWEEFLNHRTNSVISADAFEAFALEFPELTIAVLNASNLIFLNEEEFSTLSPRGLTRTEIPWVLKKGAKGASYLDDSQVIDVSSPKVLAVETTGAGDVLAGAFLTLLSHEIAIEPALSLAVTIASQSVSQFGVEHLLQ